MFYGYTPKHKKTPPGIGQRFDSVVQRSFEAILHENSRFSNSRECPEATFYGGGIENRLEMLRPRIS
jgi:hypothetical protein